MTFSVKLRCVMLLCSLCKMYIYYSVSVFLWTNFGKPEEPCTEFDLFRLPPPPLQSNRPGKRFLRSPLNSIECACKRS